MTATPFSNSRAHAVETDALLVQAQLPEPGASIFLQMLRQLATDLPLASSPVHAAWSESTGKLYAYLDLARRTTVERSTVKTLETALTTQFPQAQGIQVSRLERDFEIAGASVNRAPVFHYAVEMDPEAGWMPELFQWYDTEHMPGLASVPGCVRATRFMNHDHGPLSLACYDLVTQEALGSPPWLAVRATEWSSRMRPHFTNTIRSMFKMVA